MMNEFETELIYQLKLLNENLETINETLDEINYSLKVKGKSRKFMYCDDCRNGKEWKLNYKDDIEAIAQKKCVSCGKWLNEVKK